jgi:phospholipid/cholesterol/gamma-HCH transport system substrate-binding protein
MGEKFKLFWLGVFVLVGIALISWLLLFLKPVTGNGELLLTVRFSNIEKVSIGTLVTFAGKPVGEVKEIREITNSRNGPSDEYGNLFIYELILRVDSSVQVFTYDEINFATAGLLGEKSIAIIPKSAPFGAPPPQEVTLEVLYARSIDKLEATLHQVTDVAQGLENTMEGINQFLTTNAEDFTAALKSFSKAAEEVTTFLGSANKADFINKTAETIETASATFSQATILFTEAIERDLLGGFHSITSQLASGEGTIGRLLSNDCFYLQLTDVMCKLDRLVNDINNFGLLFQYDRGWQRLQRERMLEERCSFQSLGMYRNTDQSYCQQRYRR